jgi:hypothetical protein
MSGQNPAAFAHAVMQMEARDRLKKADANMRYANTKLTDKLRRNPRHWSTHEMTRSQMLLLGGEQIAQGGSTSGSFDRQGSPHGSSTSKESKNTRRQWSKRRPRWQTDKAAGGLSQQMNEERLIREGLEPRVGEWTIRHVLRLDDGAVLQETSELKGELIHALSAFNLGVRHSASGESISPGSPSGSAPDSRGTWTGSPPAASHDGSPSQRGPRGSEEGSYSREGGAELTAAPQEPQVPVMDEDLADAIDQWDRFLAENMDYL